jgi:hypothetical protein
MSELTGREPMLHQDKEILIKEVIFTPATQTRMMYLIFLLKGSKGAVQFVLITGWCLTDGEVEIKPIGFMGADIGYHSYVPQYEDQPESECQYLDGGKCYYDGSSLQADMFMPKFLEGGHEVVWKMLEERYHVQFD